MSSKIAIKIKRVAIIGKNPKTADTPAKIPSITREWTISDVPKASNRASSLPPIISAKKTSLVQSVTSPPTTVIAT